MSAGDRGVRPDGTKQLVAVTDGHREDTESWLDVLRDLRDRGMRAPELAVGDGALGFWAALGQVFGTTRVQRCWFHKTGNVLAALPKRLHGDANAALRKIWTAATRAKAIDAAHEFADDFAGHPKATGKIINDLDVLLTFYDFPVEHWKHLRTTNAIESTFATVRLRQKVTKGPGCRAAEPRWASSCSTPPRPAGAGSTDPSSSRSSARARRSSTANSKKGPTQRRNRPTRSALPEILQESHPQLLTITLQRASPA